jgi:O-antigen ligase
MAIAPFTFDAFVLPKILFLYVGLLLLGSFAFIFRRKTTLFHKLPFWSITLISALGVLIVISTFVSQTPLLRAMFGQFGRGNGLFYYFSALAVFLLAALSYSPKDENPFTKLMTYLSVILSFYAILQSIGIDFATLDTKGLSPVVLTLGNSNFAGAFLAMLFGFIFTRSFQVKKTDFKDLAISLLLLFGIYKTGAVQGYLIASFVIFVIVPIRIVSFAKSQIWKFLLYMFWGVVALLLALGVAGFGPLSSIFARSTFQIRIEYWKIGLKILRDNLLFGIGPDRLYDITPLYMTPGSLKLISTTSLDSPHNWFLHFGSSFGLPALILLLGLLLIPIIKFLKKLSFNVFLADQNTPTFIALLCLMIDGLVSIEQVGLGIWMYFFAGKILSPSQAKPQPDNPLIQGLVPDKFFRLSQLVVGATLILSFLSSGVILERFRNDAVLRSSIQKVVLGSQSKLDYQRIETFAIKLRAEPEYGVQAVPVLANKGDGPALLNISKSYLDYNPKSRQALAFRFEVLSAVSSRESACPLLPSLIAVTPWQSNIVENFLFCVGNGLNYEDQISLLKLIEKYIAVSFPLAKTGEATTSTDLPARALYANLQFQLGKVKEARILKQQIELDLPDFEAAFPNEDSSRITSLLDF